MHKINYKKLYKILYKEPPILSKLINELIHSIIINGNESMKHIIE